MNNLTLNDLAKLEREASAEQVDPNDYICARCGADYSLADGCEPTPLCHSCAHAFVADTAHFLPLARRALEHEARRAEVDARHAAMTTEQKSDATKRLMRFAFSDDDGNPDLSALEQPTPTGEVTMEHREAAQACCEGMHGVFLRPMFETIGDQDRAIADIAQLLATREAAAYQRGRDEAQDGWRNSANEVPEIEREVLIYYRVGRGDGIVVGRRVYGSGHWYSSGFPLREGDEIRWMPLPSPPSDPSKGGGA